MTKTDEQEPPDTMAKQAPSAAQAIVSLVVLVIAVAAFFWLNSIYSEPGPVAIVVVLGTLILIGLANSKPMEVLLAAFMIDSMKE